MHVCISARFLNNTGTDVAHKAVWLAVNYWWCLGARKDPSAGHVVLLDMREHFMCFDSEGGHKADLIRCHTGSRFLINPSVVITIIIKYEDQAKPPALKYSKYIKSEFLLFIMLCSCVSCPIRLVILSSTNNSRC
jgi:hypothetical protein